MAGPFYCNNTLLVIANAEGTVGASSGDTTHVHLPLVDVSEATLLGWGILLIDDVTPMASRRVTAWNNTTKIATVDSAYGTTPAVGVNYEICLGADSNTGVSGTLQTDGTGPKRTWTNLFATVEATAGQVGYIKTGRNYTGESDIAVTVVGTTVAATRVEGYKTTIGDYGVDEYATLAGDGVTGTNGITTALGAIYWGLVGLRCTNFPSIGFNFVSSRYLQMHRCQADLNGSHGIRIDYSDIVTDCIGNNNGGSGIYAGTYDQIYGGKYYSNTGSQIYGGSSTYVGHARVYGLQAGGYGIENGGTNGFIYNSTIWGCNNNDRGLYWASSKSSRVINNIIENCGAYAVSQGTSASNYGAQGLNNCYTGNVINFTMDSSSNINASAQMVDPANGDFRLKPTSPCLGAGYYGEDIGALQKVMTIMRKPIGYPL